MGKNPKSGTYSGYNNRPHKLPSPEDMSDELMSFTYNPNFIPPYKNFILDMATYYNELIQLFSSMKYCKVKLYHEISCQGKWHLHGFIKVLDKMKFVLFDLPVLKDKGVFEIDIIGDKDGWNKYIFKQKELMVELLAEYKIPYAIDNIDSKLLLKKIDPLQKMAKCEIIQVELSDNEEML